MPFSKNFVLSIKFNGEYLNEAADGTVALPFGSNYELHLVNKNNRRAVANIFIDEERVSGGGLVVPAFGTVDLDCNVNTKHKFLFVNQESFAAAIAGKSENINRRNGVVRIEWKLEKEYQKPIEEYTTYREIQPWRNITEPDVKTCSIPTSGSQLRSSSRRGPGGQSCASLGFSDGSTAKGLSEGCTVAGERSGMRFTTTHFDLEPGEPVTMQVVLRGIQTPPSTLLYCTGCGAKWKKRARYCQACGTRKD